jgi:uncharacterized protein YqfB (UPF0267 family)
MNLPFQTHYPFDKSRETFFEEKIMSKRKKHTIRSDKNNRWKKGNIIHFCTGLRTKNYNCFKTGVCTGTQIIQISYVLCKAAEETGFSPMLIVLVDNKLLGDVEVSGLIYNDGFETVADFMKWFPEDFMGKIVHWTNLRY